MIIVTGLLVSLLKYNNIMIYFGSYSDADEVSVSDCLISECSEYAYVFVLDVLAIPLKSNCI